MIMLLLTEGGGDRGFSIFKIKFLFQFCFSSVKSISPFHIRFDCF